MEMSLGISTSRYINFATRTSNRLEIFITRKEREKNFVVELCANVIHLSGIVLRNNVY